MLCKFNTLKGFNNLSKKFNQTLLETKQKEYKKGIKKGNRTRIPGGGRKGVLSNAELKLFFILFYFKCYPTMDIAGLFFDLVRSNVKYHIDNYTPILEKTLGKTLSLPKRKISNLKEFFELIPEAKDLFPDGTERPIQRPKNYQKQKNCYSGKKKFHTKKNLIIGNEKKRIVYLGKKHDYSIFKREFNPKTIPRKIVLWMDKGFIGVKKDYPGADIVMPKKKPKGKELSDFDKENNKTISGIRVMSEHAIAGIKRLKIVSDKFRNKNNKFNDKSMFLSCGI